MRKGIGLSLISFFFLFGPVGAWSAEPAGDLAQRGQYVFFLAGGCACHTAPKGMPHVGAREFPIPMAKIYSTNLTADKDTGLGSWSDQQIHDAMVKGIRPNGERLIPAMPYEAYSGMAQEDLKALIAYLRTLKPVRKENLRPQARVRFFRPVVTPLWLKLFGRFYDPPSRAPKSGVERGRYLAEHVALCGDCHTPRNFIGVSQRSLYMAGAKKGPFGEEIPNITPDKETGIGDWSRNDIAEILVTGTKPDLDNVQGLMEEVVEAGYKRMKREDALAIADYLKSIPPIKNKIK
ncbi:MAG TPA: cytochrome c [Candidatus Binatia bacterium]|jgi:mono/diheme cytochrome c family protein|nr:cytochrome c [Candidatus Binatia bacterium]